MCSRHHSSRRPRSRWRSAQGQRRRLSAHSRPSRKPRERTRGRLLGRESDSAVRLLPSVDRATCTRLGGCRPHWPSGSVSADAGDAVEIAQFQKRTSTRPTLLLPHEAGVSRHRSSSSNSTVRARTGGAPQFLAEQRRRRLLAGAPVASTRVSGLSRPSARAVVRGWSADPGCRWSSRWQ